MKTNKSIIAFFLILAVAIAGTTIAQAQSGDGEGTHTQVRESGGDSPIFRKNVSKTEEDASAKAKINIMGMWFPALQASSKAEIDENGDPDPIIVPATYIDDDGGEQDGIPYYDYICNYYNYYSSNYYDYSYNHYDYYSSHYYKYSYYHYNNSCSCANG